MTNSNCLGWAHGGHNGKNMTESTTREDVSPRGPVFFLIKKKDEKKNKDCASQRSKGWAHSST